MLLDKEKSEMYPLIQGNKEEDLNGILSQSTKNATFDASFNVSESYYSAQNLAMICNLDNIHKDDNCSENPNRTISSGIIVEKYYGVDSIMKHLKCDPKIGIAGTPDDLKQR